MRNDALDAMTGEGKSVSQELLFQAKLEKGIAFTLGHVDSVEYVKSYL